MTTRRSSRASWYTPICVVRCKHAEKPRAAGGPVRCCRLRARRGRARPSSTGHLRPLDRSLSRLHCRAGGRGTGIRRGRRVRSPGVQRHLRHAADARPALELPRPPRLRPDARAAGRPLLRARHQHLADRRRHHRDVAVRRVACLQEGHSPRRRDRPHRRPGHQGLDQRPGREAVARPQGHAGQGRPAPRRLHRPDRTRRRARRGQHSRR